ncbi:putative methyltransferase, partial [Rhizoctonia solani]
MALFESSWDTKSSNEALVRNSAPSLKPKIGKNNNNRRDSAAKPSASIEGNGEGTNIDLDKLLKKMSDISGGGTKGNGKEKAKGKGKEKAKRNEKESGQKGKLKEKELKGTAIPVPPIPEAIAKSPKAKKQKRKENEVPEGSEDNATAGAKRKAEESDSAVKSKKQKKNKEHTQAEPKASNEHIKNTNVPAAEEQVHGKLSELQKLVKENLQGSKFRHQTKSWPSNPVDLISTSLSTLSPRSIIVDLGCGDAQLAKTLVPQGLNVLSFDLVSDNKWVVAADICTRIPLPGSENSQCEGAIADACVCSLSLMSTNWIGCAREAWRVLRIGGRFVVAEVTSRFRDSKEFTKVLSELGFELVEQSAPSTHFLLFEFRKVERKGSIQTSWNNIQKNSEGLLKACEYKRR